MKLVSQIKKAAMNLAGARSRTLLALLGIIVGTASVVALLSAGKLATETALAQFKNMGINLASVMMNARKNTITPDTLADLPYAVPEIRLMAPYITGNLPGSMGAQSWDSAYVIGATEELAEIVNIQMQSGRFINKLDKTRYFCVIGQGILEKMKVLNPMGKNIRIGKAIFTVIGVAAQWPENSFIYTDINESIIIPLETYRALNKENSIGSMIMLLYPDSNLNAVKEKITHYFQKLFPQISIHIQTSIELINRIKTQQGIFTLLLGFIGCISLLVSGIGVANIMLASIAERRYEIGLRLAIGAKPWDIQRMFLLEAAVLGVIGGIAGVILGLLCTIIISLVAGWIFTIFWFPPVTGFCTSLLITLFFGFYPALMASKINPIDALKGN